MPRTFIRALYVLFLPQLFETIPFPQMRKLRRREVWSLAEGIQTLTVCLEPMHSAVRVPPDEESGVLCGRPTRDWQNPPPSASPLPHTPSSDGQVTGSQTAGLGLAAGTGVRIALRPSPHPRSSSYGELT